MWPNNCWLAVDRTSDVKKKGCDLTIAFLLATSSFHLIVCLGLGSKVLKVGSLLGKFTNWLRLLGLLNWLHYGSDVSSLNLTLKR